MDLIISHAHCPDGFCAAFIAKKRYPEAEVLFLDHGQDTTAIIAACSGADVLMTDFSLRTRAENDNLAAVAKSFRILDHHKTAQAILENTPYAIFDMKRSGAGLAWDYLFGTSGALGSKDWNPADPFNSMKPQPRPWYVNYVEDRDLWNWKLPMSREICAYLGTLPFEFGSWGHLDEMDPKEAAGYGQGSLAHIEHYVREVIKQSQKGRLAGYDVNILNVVYLNCSEVGNELAKTADFSVTWFERADGQIQFSLRSIGDRDVSKIATRFGGGGHKNAAGFQMGLYEGRKLIDAILSRSKENYSMRSPGGCV